MRRRRQAYVRAAGVILRRAYEALPPVKRRAADRATKELSDCVTDMHVAAAEATTDWPTAWRTALITSLPLLAGLTPEQGSEAFTERMKEAKAMVARGRAVAGHLYGVGFNASTDQIANAAKVDPTHWTRIEDLIAAHLARRSPYKAVAADLCNLMADADEQLNTFLPPCELLKSGTPPESQAWTKVIAKITAELAQ